jgi:hypothetical protein
MNWWRIGIAILALGLTLGGAGAPLSAEEAKPSVIAPELLAELRQGGFNIYFRHALTPNYKDAIDRDPDDPRPGDCSYQRNLSAEGIEQSRAIGLAFRELEIPVGISRASPMCRTMDTAWYAFGRYERDMALLLHGTEPKNDPPEAKVWAHLNAIAKILPMPGTNSVFSSHGTVGEAFGAGYLEEGEAILVKPGGKGGWSLIRRVKSNEWR